jgi:NADH-quinone oxidoreductase subunit L
LLSATYIGRLIFLTFFGKPRSEQAEDAHESPAVMWIPLAVLALGATFGGWLSLGPEGRISSFMEPIVGLVPEGEAGLGRPIFYAVAVAVTLTGLILTWWIHGSGRVDWLAQRERLEPLPRASLNGWYVDRAYDLLFVQPGKTAAWLAAFVVDAKGIDGLVNAIGGGVKRLAQGGRLMQTGFVRSYALAVFVGAVAVLAWVGWRL